MWLHRIDTNFIIKVADFGLAESMETKEYFREDKSSHIKLPLRWLAPESMDDYMFSEKSDVVSSILLVTCIKLETRYVQWNPFEPKYYHKNMQSALTADVATQILTCIQ